MPLRWLANASVSEIVNGKPGTGGPGSVFTLVTQEGDKKRHAEARSSKWPYAPKEWVGTPLENFNETMYFVPNFLGSKFNGAPLLLMSLNASNIWDLFSWLPAAQDGGKVDYKGWRLQSWQLKGPGTSLRLLVDGLNRPVLFEQNNTQGPDERDMRYEFVDFWPDETLEWVWDDFKTDDFVHPAKCPATAPTNVTMYIFHPKNEFNIAGQDLADTTGDTVFVCSDVIVNQTLSGDHAYAWLSQWEIEVMPGWGQYQNCNGYNPPMCYSAETFAVGKEAAYYIGRLPAIDRQCGANPLVGEWYSLPPAGQCKGAARPGDGSCSWRIVRKVKTIDGECLFKGEAFRQSCIQEGRAPFAKSAKLFEAAFSSSDPSSGGCPPIDSHMESLVV